MRWPDTGARKWLTAVLCLAVVAVLGLGVAVAVDPGDAAGSIPGGPDPVASAPLVDADPQPVVSITPDAATPLNPTQPIVVRVEHGTARSVGVTDSRSGDTIDGTLSPDGTSWTSTGALAYGRTYAVAVATLDGSGVPGHQDGIVRTVAPKAEAYPSFVPPPSAASVGVGQPVVVRFDHPVTDHAAAEKQLSVTSSPPQVGGWYWLSDTEVHYRPQLYWRPGTTLRVKAALFGVDLGNGTYGSTDRTETVHVHDAWVAKADGATEQMQVFDDGQLVRTMNISLGAPGFPSHTGPHVISDKQPSITMDSCTYGVCEGRPGYYKEKVDLDLRISNDGEFVHSAPWSVGQQGNENVSHGCVNLAPADAQWFYDRFDIGDVVEITKSGGPQLPIYDTYGDWELSWAQWQEGSAL